MKQEFITPIGYTTEMQIAKIDEEKLPQIFTKQVSLLEAANQEYCNADEKEKKARDRVADALNAADDLIVAAKKVGGHTAKKKKFLRIEWASRTDEINVLKKNLAELIKHSENSAEAQKKLVEVQAALMESQTAILHVQKAHMEYQRQIAETTKFVFGLGAYNMAISQSIYENIAAILSNESPEKMGELAQQQLFLALDQIRNQESIITRINENDAVIENLNLEIIKKQEEIDEIVNLEETQNQLIAEGIEKDRVQDAQIAENAEDIDQLEKQAEEQDKLIAEGIEKDQAQDKQIEENCESIAENRDNITENRESIAENRDNITENREGIAANRDNIAENRSKNAEQDKDIEENRNKNLEQDVAIKALKADIEKLKDDLKKKNTLLIGISAISVAALLLSIVHFFI